jgi:moderate conductance mechanosensitive channel
MPVSFDNLFINKFFVSLLFLIGGFLVYKLLSLLIDRVFHRMDPDAPYGLSTFDQRVFALSDFMRHILRFVVMVLVVFLVLAVFQSNMGSIAIFLGLLILAVSSGLSELIRDFARGFLIFFENHYQTGDRVEVDEIQGIVEKINLRTTFLRGPDGEQIIIPNHLVRVVVNYSKSPVKTEVKIGLSKEVEQAKMMQTLDRTVDEFYQKNTGHLAERPKISGMGDVAENQTGIKIEFKIISRKAPEVLNNFKKNLEENLNREKILFSYFRDK